MIYYSALLKYFDHDLWELFEMQICRTNTCSSMSLISIIRTAEGFARRPSDIFEVFGVLEHHISARIEKESLDLNELCRVLFCFASLNKGELNFYNKLQEKIEKQITNVNLDQAEKILWSLSTMEMHGNLLKTIAKHVSNNLDSMPPLLKRNSQWSLAKLKLHNKLYQHH